MRDLADLAKLDYVARVNRAIDHITRHLDAPLGLDEVASVACFSPFHFHRIFKSVTGETLHDFVSRVRLERAVHLMSHEPSRTLTDVALDCGLGGSAEFSRRFRRHFGVAPRRFDLARYRQEGRAMFVRAAGVAAGPRLGPGDNPDGFAVTLRRVPERRVAYRRVFQPYAGRGVRDAAGALLAWADSAGLADGQWLGYQWDDPEVVPLDRCRYDVGLEVPEGVTLGEGVSEARFAAMTVAEIPLRGDAGLELRALDWIYTTWLPRSGYAPAHQPCFEAWDGRPFAHGTSYFELRLQLAVTDGRDQALRPRRAAVPPSRKGRARATLSHR